FFFSSRRRHTRSKRDWSSDVCSSDLATQARIKATYPEIFARCRESFGCFIHDADPRKALEVSPEEREAFFEKLYREPGFGIWMRSEERRVGKEWRARWERYEVQR